MFSGFLPMRGDVTRASAVAKKTIPFLVDAINDADYINGIVYGGKCGVDEALERIGIAVDDLENFCTSLEVFRGIPDAQHVEALRAGLPRVLADLRAGMFDLEQGIGAAKV